MSDWISVKERLPEIHKSLFGASEVVLIAYQSQLGLVTMPAVLVERGGGVWYTVGSNLPITDVTHWMPLPEPPQEETREGE